MSLSQDTEEPYTTRQLGLPAAGAFTAAAIVLGKTQHSVQGIRDALDVGIAKARQQSAVLTIAFFPENALERAEGADIQALQQLAFDTGVDLVVSFTATAAGVRSPSTLLITGEGPKRTWTYRRVHPVRNESISTADEFLVIDRPYGRVAILQGEDIFAPEATEVLAKMGVDVVAVPVNSPEPNMLEFLRSRSNGDYLHVISANQQGDAAIFAGGYQASPSEQIGKDLAIMTLDTSHVRNKKEPRFLDVEPLLRPCSSLNC